MSNWCSDVLGYIPEDDDPMAGELMKTLQCFQTDFTEAQRAWFKDRSDASAAFSKYEDMERRFLDILIEAAGEAAGLWRARRSVHLQGGLAERLGRSRARRCGGGVQGTSQSVGVREPGVFGVRLARGRADALPRLQRAAQGGFPLRPPG